MRRSRKNNVCLFGTSANPPTGDGGHAGIVKALSKLDHFHEIRVIPVYRHNFSSKRNSLLAYHHRYRMCQVSFGSIPKVTVSDAERTLFERKIESMSDAQKENVRVGTAELLEMLGEEESESEFSFCLGTDTFVDLTSLRWKRSADVLRLLEGRLVVFSRKGGDTITQEQIEWANQRLGIDAQLLEVETLTDVSSSMIRASKDDEILQKSLSPSVLEYIKEHQLYAYSSQNSLSDDEQTGEQKNRI